MAEKQKLEANSLFIKFKFGYDTKGKQDFQNAMQIIKGYWNRVYLPKTYEWEVPFSCWEEIKQLYKDYEISYLNEPPKAKKVTDSEILEGMDFNGYNLFDYQLEGVKYGLNHHNYLLLDEQRIGKNATNHNYSQI